jgi:SAM-dependent methyltransferase
VAWLVANSYPTIGYDASEGLLAQARKIYPGLEFAIDALPGLSRIRDETFDNVLCETVIMHLVSSEIAHSVCRLLAILKPGGILYLSWRVTVGSDQRDGHGRLYAAFDPTIVWSALGGATILLNEEALSASSGKTIHRIVACKRVDVI